MIRKENKLCPPVKEKKFTPQRKILTLLTLARITNTQLIFSWGKREGQLARLIPTVPSLSSDARYQPLSPTGGWRQFVRGWPGLLLKLKLGNAYEIGTTGATS